ncbi:hypothetical protein Tco_1385558 [Tanacetum coccineum]
MSTFLQDRTCDCDVLLRVLTAWTSTIMPKMHLYEMHTLLNPQQRRHLAQESSHQGRIQELEVILGEKNTDLQKTMKSLTFWKSTFFAFVVCSTIASSDYAAATLTGSGSATTTLTGSDCATVTLAIVTMCYSIVG